MPTASTSIDLFLMKPVFISICSGLTGSEGKAFIALIFKELLLEKRLEQRSGKKTLGRLDIFLATLLLQDKALYCMPSMSELRVLSYDISQDAELMLLSAYAVFRAQQARLPDSNYRAQENALTLRNPNEKLIIFGNMAQLISAVIQSSRRNVNAYLQSVISYLSLPSKRAAYPMLLPTRDFTSSVQYILKIRGNDITPQNIVSLVSLAISKIDSLTKHNFDYDAVSFGHLLRTLYEYVGKQLRYREEEAKIYALAASTLAQWHEQINPINLYDDLLAILGEVDAKKVQQDLIDLTAFLSVKLAPKRAVYVEALLKLGRPDEVKRLFVVSKERFLVASSDASSQDRATHYLCCIKSIIFHGISDSSIANAFAKDLIKLFNANSDVSNFMQQAKQSGEAICAARYVFELLTTFYSLFEKLIPQLSDAETLAQLAKLVEETVKYVQPSVTRHYTCCNYIGVTLLVRLYDALCQTKNCQHILKQLISILKTTEEQKQYLRGLPVDETMRVISDCNTKRSIGENTFSTWLASRFNRLSDPYLLPVTSRILLSGVAPHLLDQKKIIALCQVYIERTDDRNLDSKCFRGLFQALTNDRERYKVVRGLLDCDDVKDHKLAYELILKSPKSLLPKDFPTRQEILNSIQAPLYSQDIKLLELLLLESEPKQYAHVIKFLVMSLLGNSLALNQENNWEHILKLIIASRDSVLHLHYADYMDIVRVVAKTFKEEEPGFEHDSRTSTRNMLRELLDQTRDPIIRVEIKAAKTIQASARRMLLRKKFHPSPTVSNVNSFQHLLEYLAEEESWVWNWNNRKEQIKNQYALGESRCITFLELMQRLEEQLKQYSFLSRRYKSAYANRIKRFTGRVDWWQEGVPVGAVVPSLKRFNKALIRHLWGPFVVCLLASLATIAVGSMLPAIMMLQLFPVTDVITTSCVSAALLGFAVAYLVRAIIETQRKKPYEQFIQNLDNQDAVNAYKNMQGFFQKNNEYNSVVRHHHYNTKTTHIKKSDTQILLAIRDPDAPVSLLS